MAEKPAILTRHVQMPAELQNINLFRIYIFYRSLLSIVLLLSMLGSNTGQFVGTLNPTLYLYVAYAFLATNLVLIGLIGTRFITSQVSLFTVFFVDIIAITLLSDTSGGMASGLPILFVVTAAASGILISSGTIATLIAALCVIAVLADTTRLINEQVLPINTLFPAGLLGVLIFAVSLLIQLVARRVGKAEELARKRATDLYNLQRLNEQIVQHLQTGILMVYANGSVRVMNQAATRLLDPQRQVPLEQGRQLLDYNPTLAEQFSNWINTGAHQPTPIQISGDAPPIVVNFSGLENTGSGEALVFIEDYSPVTQQAQSLKLTSLGRLTASIAHEVRNPLGAISHASQLLSESVTVTDDDKRMIAIILDHCNRVNLIIEDVLDASRHDDTTPDLIDLELWLNNFIENYRATHELCDEIKLDITTKQVKVKVIQGQLEQVLNNLFDNGLRYSHKQTGKATLLVQAGIESKDGDELPYLHIIDDGPGINEEDESRLFEPFHTTESSGTGLGLYISKELCEANQSQLVYGRTPSGKSSFSIYFGNPDRVMA